jgi:hypothetical protein
MPDDEKDRLGDKLRDLERAREDKYFADRDRELVEKMRHRPEEPKTTPQAQIACPKCRVALTQAKYLGVTVEECPSCGGVWLDKGELQELAQREQNGWLARFLGRDR